MIRVSSWGLVLNSGGAAGHTYSRIRIFDARSDAYAADLDPRRISCDLPSRLLVCASLRPPGVHHRRERGYRRGRSILLVKGEFSGAPLIASLQAASNPFS